MQDEGRRPGRFHPASRFLAFALLALAACREPVSAVHDDLGRPVQLPREVRRIVTLAPNLTEIAFAIGAGGKVVATDDYSDAPAAAKQLPKVGGVQPSVERILSARPDLVLAVTSGNHPALAAALSAAGVPLYVVRTDRLADVPRVMRRLGVIARADGAEAAARQLEKTIASERRVRRRSPRVLFLIWTAPLYVGGRDTFADDLLQLAGGRNAVDVRGWPQYSLESVVAAPPDIIIHPDKSVQQPQIEALVAAAPQLLGCRIVAVDENRFTRPGPSVTAAAGDLDRIFDAWERSH